MSTKPGPARIKNIDDLGKRLIGLFESLEDGTVDIKQAVELNNTAGKIINAYKSQLAYHALRGEAPIVPFLAAAQVDKRVATQLPR